MNERLRALEKQSGMDVYGLGLDRTKWEERLAKFSELIVQEMCGLMEQAEDDAYHCFEPGEVSTEYIDWLRNWQEAFEKHFKAQQ